MSDNKDINPETGLPIDTPCPSRKPKKVTRFDAQSFISAWVGALTSKEDPVGQLRSMIKAGVAGECSGIDAQLIPPLLGRSGVAERLALPLATQERFGKLMPVGRLVLSGLRPRFEQSLDLDPDTFTSYRSAQSIEQWIRDHTPQGQTADLDNWVRRLLVCALKVCTRESLSITFIAAVRAYLSHGHAKARQDENSFYQQMTSALITPSTSKKKLMLAMAGIYEIESQFRDLLSRQTDLERQVRAQQDSIKVHRDERDHLEQQLADARGENKQNTIRISQLEHSLSESSERYTLLDRHWRAVSEQQLAKQSGSFKERVRHEVEEALLALDREQPNLDMGLERLRRIKEILER